MPIHPDDTSFVLSKADQEYNKYHDGYSAVARDTARPLAYGLIGEAPISTPDQIAGAAAIGAVGALAATKSERKLETRQAVKEVLADKEALTTISNIVREGLLADLAAKGYIRGKN